MNNLTHRGHKFTTGGNTGITKFKVNNGNCHVQLKSRFCFTPDQLVRIKQIIETTGYETNSDRHTILVRISLDFMKWFPREYHLVTLSAEYDQGMLCFNKVLNISIN